MWLNELWTRWLGRASRKVRRQRRHRLTPTRTRLRLEALEDRTLLSAPIGTTGDLVNAIVSANTAGGSTTLTLASGTTFDFTTANNSTNGANALPVITANITIVGNGDTLNGSGVGRLFYVANGGSLNLENAALTGGRAQGTGAAAEGGAIYSSGTLTLSAVTLMSNVAQGNNGYSGGQSSPGGDGASAYGGGLYVAGGTVALTDVTVSNNNATGGNGGNGGSGGPGSTGYRYHYTNYYYNSSGVLYNTTQNSSGYNGGPGGPGGSGGSGGSSSGGGLYVAGGTVTLNNDTLSSNQANGGYGGSGGPGGAGIDRNIYITRYNYYYSYNDYSSAHTTSYGGGSRGPSGSGGSGGTGSGGGVYVGSGSVTLHNTLISGNSGGDVSGGLDSASDYNLIGDGSGGLSTANHNLLGINPLLAPLSYYGGPTQTMALLPGSPAIDAGSSAYGGSTDQRGESRVGATDIGAFESQGFALAVSSGNNQFAAVDTAFADPLRVSVTANNPVEPVAGGAITFTAPTSGASAVLSGSPATIGSDGQASATATANGTSGTYTITASATGSVSPANFSLINAGIVVVTTLSDENDPTDGTTSLREAISYAETQSIPYTITFDPSILTKTSDNVIDLLSALPNLIGNITIEGPGANVLTVQRDASAAAFSVFTVDAGATAAISGLTISGGSTTEGGGGIANSGTLTVSDCTLSGNSSSLGGGIANGGSLIVSDCALSGNSAAEGGGIFNEGSLMVSDSTLSGDSALGGGGILNEGSVTVSDSTLSGNSANAGSGIDVISGDVLLHNTLIAGNQGDDVSGSLDSASDYNLIGDGSGGLSTANHNLLGSSASLLDPLLAPLGNYGGPTETMALLPGSPAIDAGSSAYGGSTDQRGKGRVGATDIGAFESQGFSIAVSGGNNQFATIDTAFADPLVVAVTANNPVEPVAGGRIAFTAPASGASAYFSGHPAAIGPNGTASITATANGTAGTYTVSASATGISSPAKFSLTNSLGDYTPVSIASLTNADARSSNTGIPNTFVDGSNFPIAPTSITVAGVPFDLVPYANEANSLGVIETYGITTPFTIPTSVFGATTVYTLMNSVWGTSGDDVGTIEFKGANPANDVVFQIVEGNNIRDYFNGSYNNAATNIVPDPFLNGVQNPNGSNRLDMQTFSLPAGFANDTLTQIIFTGFGGDPQGVPFLAAATVAKPGNLIANGDFESGNIGFTTGYTYSPGNIEPETTYDIVTNPHNSHPGGESYGDHTTGHGLMMAINGATSYPTTVWSETVSVQPNTNYQFSGWVSDWSALRDSALPELNFNFNSVLVGQFNVPPNEPIGQWDNVTFTWNSGNNSTLNITIIDAQTAAVGNDFALDDLSLQATSSAVSQPTLSVTDAGGTYNGSAFPATAKAVGVDGKTPVSGSFSYAYYDGSSVSGTPSATAPTNAGTYTVVATFTSSDPNYASGGTAQTTFTIKPATPTVTSTADDGSVGTLRWVITGFDSSSSNFTSNEIDFSIGAVGIAQTIKLKSALPALTASGVYLNGLSQGGNGNTKLLIALNGSGAGASDGLLLQGSNCTVSGLTLENFAENGIEVEGSNDTIGGSVLGAGNVISGNSQDGVLLDSTASGTVVQGNSIGVNAAGATEANGGYGIGIAGTNNTIGGAAYRARNIIAGNSKDGVLFASSASGNLLLGNLIGVNAVGNAVANSVGVEVAGTNNTLGGVATGSRNIISGNSHDGVLLDSTASGNLVLGNYVGTNLYGSAALGNSGNGIEIAGNSNTLGSTNAAANNVISGNSNDGVLLDSGASGNQVLGNFIGTDYTGTTALANTVGIEDAGNNNTLGGSVLGARNIISGNTGDGVLLDSTASGETVQGNFMGLNKEGTAALANGSNGIEIQGTNNTIGGNSRTDYFTRNFLTGNGNDGVLIDSGGSGNQVLGNFIGVDISGTHGVGNVGNGVEIAGSSNTVGGTMTGLGNTISGSSKDGVLLGSTATGNLVQGNDIGTDYTGRNALGNSSNGIEVSGVNNTLGGTTAGAGNVIAANSDNGVQIDSGASGTLVLGNYIGTNAAGGSLGNGGNGVSISGNNNTIGGNAYRAANTIAHNNEDGVLVNGGTGNSLLRNSIFANTGLGISLANGGNNNVAAPSVTSASYSGGTLTVDVTYDAPLANVSYAIELFASPGSDEGAVYLGTITLTPKSTGTQSFTYKTTTAVVGSNPIITATITDASGDTSEFSPGISA